VLKKAGAVAAIAAGMMMIGSPAFAHDGDFAPAGGSLVSAANGNNVGVNAGACGNSVGVFGGSLPINSLFSVENCAVQGQWAGYNSLIGG
jgi:hypothetical protein